MRVSLFRLVIRDFSRYTSLHYLTGASVLCKSVAALRHPGLRTVWYFRVRHAASGLPPMLRFMLNPLFLALRLVLWPSSSCDLAPEAEIGGGCFLPHPIGVVIAPGCRIGGDVSLFSGVVLGINHLSADRSPPTLGNHVTVYTGAKIVGFVKVGDRVIVGANAVVNADIEPHTVVGGVPARPIGSSDERSQLVF